MDSRKTKRDRLAWLLLEHNKKGEPILEEIYISREQSMSYEVAEPWCHFVTRRELQTCGNGQYRLSTFDGL